MAKFKFRTKESITAFNVTFTDGKPSEVKDEHAIAKLRGNTEFTEVKAGK